MNVQLKRIDDDFHFEALGDSGIPVNIDASEKAGGHNNGARPMELILMAVGSCSAIDIISILKKQRQQIDNFTISINGERRDKPLPNVIETIQLSFNVTGKIDENKLQRAIDLSMKKYCSVTAMLEPHVTISVNYILNGSK